MKRIPMRRAGLVHAAGIIIAVLAVPILLSADPAQSAREADVEKLIAQGDAYFRQGNYNLAVGTYVEAAGISKSRLNLSACYFGLAQCSFYQRDNAASLKWLRKTIEVDPNKAISAGFYPQSFFNLFQQAKREARQGRSGPAGTETVTTPAPKPEEVVAAERQEPVAAVRREEPPPRTVTTSPQLPPLNEENPGGHWEIGAHFSTWTVNPIMSIFKSDLVSKLGDEIQNEINKKISGNHEGLVKGDFTPNISLSSSGQNYGLEVRYFATGWAGTFSIGASLEETHMKFSLTGTPHQTFTNGSFADATVQADLETATILTTDFSFRWEIGTARVRPYFVFGFGFGTLDGKFNYSYTGTYSFGSYQDTIGDSVSKTFAQLSNDIDFKIPTMFVVLHLSVGLKIDVAKGLSVLGEAGIWDGLILRGGLAYRF